MDKTKINAQILKGLKCLKRYYKQAVYLPVIGYNTNCMIYGHAQPPIHITVPYVNQTPPGLDNRGPPTMQRYQR